MNFNTNYSVSLLRSGMVFISHQSTPRQRSRLVCFFFSATIPVIVEFFCHHSVTDTSLSLFTHFLFKLTTYRCSIYFFLFLSLPLTHSLASLRKTWISVCPHMKEFMHVKFSYDIPQYIPMRHVAVHLHRHLCCIDKKSIRCIKSKQ